MVIRGDQITDRYMDGIVCGSSMEGVWTKRVCSDWEVLHIWRYLMNGYVTHYVHTELFDNG